MAVNGACLTVTRATEQAFEAEIVQQTLRLTTLGELPPGAIVNLERALAIGQRLGGHLVTGHVDGVGRVRRIETLGVGRTVDIEIPAGSIAQVAARGSIAIDGISLTVAEVVPGGVVLALIPETLAATTAGSYVVGTRVNVETDLLAKYVQACLSRSAAPAAEDNDGDEEASITEDRLRELGFLR